MRAPQSVIGPPPDIALLTLAYEDSVSITGPSLQLSDPGAAGLKGGKDIWSLLHGYGTAGM